MRVAIIGSRSIDFLKTFQIDAFLVGLHIDEIVSGGAAGVDAAAGKYANEKSISLKIFEPDYKSHGKAAPHIRNREIVDYSDLIVAIWDGKSKGTASVIKYSVLKKKEVRIFEIN
jgi:hypothetical protein